MSSVEYIFFGLTTLFYFQYPIVSIDADMPVLNPFNRTQYGFIRVLLAMGSTEQVSALQLTKLGKDSAVMVAERPTHYLER